MKYSRKVILEDNKIFKGLGTHEIARRVKKNPAYISRLINGRLIATEQQYTRIKNLIDNYCKQG